MDKAERQIVTSQIAKDILSTYQKLGGAKWLLEWAGSNQTEFIRQCLSRLMPPMPRDGDDAATFNTQVNIGNLSDFEAARRIAFALAKATQPEQPPVEAQRLEPEPMTPQEACQPPRWAPEPELIPDPEPAPEESLATYRGGRAEHGSPSRQDLYGKKPSR